MSLVVALGITAGLLQALGYALYVYMTLKHDVRPNASTWFMFAYGTSLLAVLEMGQGASWMLLILPASCAILGVLVAFLCWRRGTLRWPENIVDRASFITDLVLTVCYFGAWLLRENDVLNDSQTWYATVAFLVLSNLTTLSSFTPILRETLDSPFQERSEPWVVWTIAYATLGLATVAQNGWYTSLLLYPLINAPLHAGMAWLSRASRKRRLKQEIQASKAALIS